MRRLLFVLLSFALLSGAAACSGASDITAPSDNTYKSADGMIGSGG